VAGTFLIRRDGLYDIRDGQAVKTITPTVGMLLKSPALRMFSLESTTAGDVMQEYRRGVCDKR